jgi:hypothetical protein
LNPDLSVIIHIAAIWTLDRYFERMYASQAMMT